MFYKFCCLIKFQLCFFALLPEVTKLILVLSRSALIASFSCNNTCRVFKRSKCALSVFIKVAHKCSFSVHTVANSACNVCTDEAASNDPMVDLGLDSSIATDNFSLVSSSVSHFRNNELYFLSTVASSCINKNERDWK